MFSEANGGGGLLVHVDGVDEAHLVGSGGHHQAVGPAAVGEIANPAEEGALGHPRGSEDDVVTRSEVRGSVDAVDIRDPHLLHTMPAGVLQERKSLQDW